MNIYDISKKAGVSIATVSRVLNGSGKVSDKTREKILSVIEETGYTPNAFARSLGLNTMKTIGILCADSSDMFLASAIYYLEQELRQHGYDSILCCTGYAHDTKQKYLELLLSKRVDAVILAGSNFVEQTPSLNQYILDAAKELPVVIVNAYLEGENIYCALCDDAQATYQVTQKLLESGRKRPFYLYRTLTYSGQQKLLGYTKACQEFGLSADLIVSKKLNGSLYETRDILLKQYPSKQFDAFITSDDEMAIAVLKYAKAIGCSIPEDISIVGYNNSKIGICCEPELTSVDNRLEFSCMNAVTVLMKVLDNKPVPAKTMISANVMARGTTTITF